MADYHNNSRCGSCHGPLEAERDAICLACCPVTRPVDTEVGKCVRCGLPVIQDEHGCLHQAMSGTIDGGYGSRNDLSSFTAFICDDCAYAVAPIVKYYDGTVHNAGSRDEYNAWVAKHWDENGNVREAAT